MGPALMEWKGSRGRPQPHFCTNPIDLISLGLDYLSPSLRFRGKTLQRISEPPRNCLRFQFAARGVSSTCTDQK
jgi:hypothetical protein